MTNETNCCILEKKGIPIKNVMCVNLILVQLTNKCVKDKLTNGSVGTVREICYPTKDKRRHEYYNYPPIAPFQRRTNLSPIDNKPGFPFHFKL